jgi:hypothetical protein
MFPQCSFMTNESAVAKWGTEKISTTLSTTLEGDVETLWKPCGRAVLTAR